MTDYRVSLDVYNGPLDLLLYLIRREELDIYDIPIARITEQYISYVDVLQDLDPEAVSEFLVLAATLMEIKSRTLLPRPPALEEDEEIIDPRTELVRQLLQYKAFKDAAHSLEDAADVQHRRHPRLPAIPPAPDDEVELEDLEIWDLFDAFNKLLEQTGKKKHVHRVDVDDTPISLHADDIADSLERAGGRQTFQEIFSGRSRGEMIGLFLALLELIRQCRVRAVQDEPVGQILIVLLSSEPIRSPEEQDASGPRFQGDLTTARTEPEDEGEFEEDAEPEDEGEFEEDAELEKADEVEDGAVRSYGGDDDAEAPSDDPSLEEIADNETNSANESGELDGAIEAPDQDDRLPA